jgi:hypothetical protein
MALSTAQSLHRSTAATTCNPSLLHMRGGAGCVSALWPVRWGRQQQQQRVMVVAVTLTVNGMRAGMLLSSPISRVYDLGEKVKNRE